MTDITRLNSELVARVLTSEAAASPALRRAAFDNAGLTEPIRALIEKVAQRSYQVTDKDIAEVRKAGFSEDQVFELVVSAAVGQANRHYASGLAALADATGAQR